MKIKQACALLVICKHLFSVMLAKVFSRLHYSWPLQINEVSATTYNLSLRFVHDEAIHVPSVQWSVTERRVP